MFTCGIFRNWVESPSPQKKTQKSKNKQTENPKDKTKQNKARNREWKDLSGGESKGILESSWLRFSLGMVSQTKDKENTTLML